MDWQVLTWGKVVDDEIDALALDVLAKLARFRREIELHGPASLPMAYAKYLGDRLWELRLSGRDGIARVIYFTVHPRRVVLLRAFVKKTQKTPRREIELARKRARTLMI